MNYVDLDLDLGEGYIANRRRYAVDAHRRLNCGSRVRLRDRTHPLHGGPPYIILKSASLHLYASALYIRRSFFATKQIARMPHKENFVWAQYMILLYVQFHYVGKNTDITFPVCVSPNHTVGLLKQHLQKTGKFIPGSKLLLKGVELRDDALLNGAGVRNETRLNVRSFAARKKPTGHPIRVRVTDSDGNEKTVMKISIVANTNFLQLAHMVQDECGMPVEEQTWYKDKKVLRMSKYKTLPVTGNYMDYFEVKWSPPHTIGPMVCARVLEPPKPIETDEANPPCQFDRMCKQDILKLLPAPNAVISRNGLMAISREMVYWKQFSDKLGITKAERVAIKHNYSSDFEEQKFQCLLCWKQQNGKDATWKEILSACIDIKKFTLAKRIIEICK